MKKIQTIIVVAITAMIIAACSSINFPSLNKGEPIEGLGLTRQEVVDSYIYTFARYLVIRQEHIDIAEDGVDYNVIKYNELGKAEFVNPNLDVAYFETWFAVDEQTPVILEIPKIEERYYTAQIVDEWAEIVANINERNYPDHSYGKFALVLKGSNPEIPEDAMRIELPSKKAKMLGRVERKGDDKGALELQQSFRIIKTGEPEIDPAVSISMFSNETPIMVDVFQKPMVEKVLESAPDNMTIAPEMQTKVMAIADFVEKSDTNRALVDEIIQTEAFPALIHYIKNFGDRRGGWSSTREFLAFDDDIWFRAAANFAGIWWNSSEEVVYYVGEADDAGEPLNGDNLYVIHFPADELPQQQVNSYWSLTLMSLPDYRVVPNDLNRYNLNNQSPLVFEADGSLKLYLGAELPAGKSQANWLPAPEGKPFTLNLRMYVPKQAVLSGDYYVPPLRKLD